MIGCHGFAIKVKKKLTLKKSRSRASIWATYKKSQMSIINKDLHNQLLIFKSFSFGMNFAVSNSFASNIVIASFEYY